MQNYFMTRFFKGVYRPHPARALLTLDMSITSPEEILEKGIEYGKKIAEKEEKERKEDIDYGGILGYD